MKGLLMDIKKYRYRYLIILPVVIYLAIFCYKPMYGIVIAFQRYRPSLGIGRSKFVGLDNFVRFFNDIYFSRIIKNTFSISLLSILSSIPVPVCLALMLNEIRSSSFKRTAQTVLYLPHFISLVIVCGLVKTFTQTNGVINDMIAFCGGTRSNLLSRPSMFYPIYILSNLWQNMGWDSIIYLAALAAVDQEQYEAARVDGAGRWKQMIYITLPSILPTISMMLILKLGSILNVGYEKILLLYQPITYEVADVISTYVYRKGLLESDFSYSTAVGIFNSVVNLFFLLMSNFLSKRMGQTGLF